LEQTAAKELKQYLNTVTGSDFKIVLETEIDAVQPQIVVGNSKRVKELLPEIDVATIPYDGIVIKTVGKNLVLLGHPQRGTLYAVNTFLEDVVGVRWWTSTESFIPKKTTLEISEQNIQYNPKFIYRESLYTDVFTCPPVFLTRMKCNGSHNNIPAELGGQHKFFHFVHSFYPLLPPEKYFKDHPEWYSEINGKRTHDHAQLCLTNGEMKNEMTRVVLDGLRKNPNATIVSISTNDGGGDCRCASCKAVFDEEGGQSGVLLRFVNQIAEEVEKEFPSVWVETIAYGSSLNPPKSVKPRDNVIIMICPIGASYSQPIAEGSHNERLRNQIVRWSRIANNLYIWDYNCNFASYMLPHPNLHVFAPNIRFFRDHSVIGLFNLGDERCSAGDFARLKTWLLDHLMWNPSLDEEELIDEFLTGYYGANAAPYLKKYWKLLSGEVQKSGYYLKCYELTTNRWLSTEKLNEAAQLVSQAIDVTQDETLRNRLRREKMSIDYTFLKEHQLLVHRAEAFNKPFTGLRDPQTAVNDFLARIKEFNVTSCREWDRNGQMFPQFELDLQQAVRHAAPVPEFCQHIPKSSWYSIENVLEYRLFEHGRYSFSVGDEKASNGRALKIAGWNSQRMTSHFFDNIVAELKSAPPQNNQNIPNGNNNKDNDKNKDALYRVYLAVRCDANVSHGHALEWGIWSKNKEQFRQFIDVSEIIGKDYHWIKTPPIQLEPGGDLWFAPPNRPNEVDAVYVDRIIVVRE
jgi:hypothetical protein